MPQYVTAMFPLKITDGAAGFDQISKNDLTKLINQHLEFILFTRKGEIISDVSFGVGIEDYVFLQQNESKLLRLNGEINMQISRYLGYLTSFKVNVDFSHVDYNQLGVQIKYRVDKLNVDEVATFFVGPEFVK